MDPRLRTTSGPSPPRASALGSPTNLLLRLDVADPSGNGVVPADDTPFAALFTAANAAPPSAFDAARGVLETALEAKYVP